MSGKPDDEDDGVSLYRPDPIRVSFPDVDATATQFLRKRPSHNLPMEEYLAALEQMANGIRDAYIAEYGTVPVEVQTRDWDGSPRTEKVNFPTSQVPYQYYVSSRILMSCRDVRLGISMNDAIAVFEATRRLYEALLGGFPMHQKSVSSLPRSQAKAIAGKVFDRLRKSKNKVTHNDLIAALLDEGCEDINAKTVQNWLSEFRRNSR